MTTTRLVIGLAVVVAGLLGGCASHDPVAKVPPPERSLFARMGGMPAIRAVSNDFVDRAAADPRVNITRKGTGHEWQPTPENVALLKTRVVEYVCMVTGGGCAYHGRDMRTVHRDMAITNAEFDAGGQALKASLDTFRVGEREQKEFLAAVEGTRKDIVTRQ